MLSPALTNGNLDVEKNVVAATKRPQNGLKRGIKTASKRPQTRHQNGLKTASKWPQNGLKTASKNGLFNVHFTRQQGDQMSS
jgi:hypothetical protein